MLRPADVAAPCRSFVPSDGRPAPASLQRPPGRVAVSSVSEQNGTQQVMGYVTLAPAPFLHAWRDRSGVHVEGEEEGFEAEVEVEAGGKRVAWKLRRVCANGSSFLATVTGETD